MKVKRQFHPIYSIVFHNLKAKMSTSSRTDRLPRERKEIDRAKGTLLCTTLRTGSQTRYIYNYNIGKKLLNRNHPV